MLGCVQEEGFEEEAMKRAVGIPVEADFHLSGLAIEQLRHAAETVLPEPLLCPYCRGCPMCGKPLPKSLGKRPRVTCSPKCRTAKSRRGRGVA